MKTITNLAKTVLVMILFALGSNVFGQNIKENNQEEKFRLKIVRDENGKKEVVDQTFHSRAEMEAYMKEHHIDVKAPDGDMADAEVIVKNFDKKCDKKEISRCTKVMVIEKEENGVGKNRKSHRADKEDESMNTTVVIQKEDKDVLAQAMDKEMLAEAAPPRESTGSSLPEPTMGNAQTIQPALSELSLYPNPTGGNFHISFRTEKPLDVTLRMTDVTGKQVYFNVIRNQEGLFEKDIYFAGGLPKGTYLLEANSGDQKVTTRVVVQ